MAKRFIDTKFMSKTWIRKLTPAQKIFIVYLMLNCDHAGIIELDMEHVEFWIGETIGDPMGWLPPGYILENTDGKHFIPKFIEHQYGTQLNPNHKLHKKVLEILEKEGFLHTYESVVEDLPNPSIRVKDKEEEKEQGTKKKKRTPAKVEPRALVYPFEDDRFLAAWDVWKDYKANEHKFKYKSEATEQAALKQLGQLSNGNLEVSLAIIEQSLANGWKGFFELKGGTGNEPKTPAQAADYLQRVKNAMT